MTTRELAELAGVSQSTVSRSLNDHPSISPETSERIRILAKKHGYIIKKSSKKSIAIQKNRAIAILSTDNGNDDMYLNSLFNSLFKFISKENYLSFFENEKSGIPMLDKVKDLVNTRMMDGFLIIQREYDAEIDQFLNEIGIPHVYIHYFSINSVEQVNIIDSDHYIGAYTATKHLISLGHKKILTVSSPGREFSDRSNGFFTALKDFDLEFDTEKDILYCDHTYSSGYSLAKKCFDKFKNYTAMFGQSDEMSIGCLNALQDNGMKIPEDFSIIGFDGIKAGKYCRPALTTVGISTDEIAKAAITRITEMMTDNGAYQNMRSFIQPTLLTRNSTAEKI